LKIKNISVLCALVLAILILSGIEVKSLSGDRNEKEIREEIVKMIIAMNPELKSKLKEGKNMLINLADQIIKDNKRFSTCFKEREFEKMVELYEQRGSIVVTPEYSRLYGQAIALFLCKMWKPKAVLKFRTVHIYLNNSIDNKDKKEFDFIANVINEIHVILSNRKGKICNETLVEIRTYRHRFDCWWEY
jgi:hypothetical protein